MAFIDHIKSGATDGNPLYVAIKDARDGRFGDGVGGKIAAFAASPFIATKNSLQCTFNKGKVKADPAEAMLASGSAQATQEAAVE